MYLILYYVSFLVTIVFVGFTIYKSTGLLSYFDGSFSETISRDFSNIFYVIIILLVIIFTILILKKKKIQVSSIVLPIIYLCFFAGLVILCFLFNNKVMVRYVHFEYYSIFVCIGYLFLNVYSLLLIKYKK